MRSTDPSDISMAKFERIKDLLEHARKRTKPRTAVLFNTLSPCLLLPYFLLAIFEWADFTHALAPD